MVGLGGNAVLRRAARPALGAFAALAINDAAVARARAEELQHLLGRLGLGHDAIGEVGPVEAGDEAARLAQLQLLDDVRAHALGGGGGQRHHRARRERASRSSASWRYSGPEIVAPFADAMRLVHGDQVHVPALQIVQETRRASAAPARHRAGGIRPGAGRAGAAAIRRRPREELRKVAAMPAACSASTWSFISAIRARPRPSGPAGAARAIGSRAICRRRWAAARTHPCPPGVADDFPLQRPKRGEAEISLQQPQPGFFGGIHQAAVKHKPAMKASGVIAGARWGCCSCRLWPGRIELGGALPDRDRLAHCAGLVWRLWHRYADAPSADTFPAYFDVGNAAFGLLVRAFRSWDAHHEQRVLGSFGGFAQGLGEGEVRLKRAGRQVGCSVQLPGVGNPFVDQDEARAVLVEDLFE